MSSSLVLSTAGELLPAAPRAAGLHVLLDYSLGDPKTATAAVEALLLDGERVHRTHVGNRSFTLPVFVIGADRDDLTLRVDALLDAVQAVTYELTWTPDGGLPIVFDCFPAEATVRYDVRIEDVAFGQQVDLVIPALPYGRSPVATTPTVTQFDEGSGWRLFTLSDLIGSARAPVAAHLSFTGAVDAWLLHRPPVDADPLAPIVTELTAGAGTIADAERLFGTYSIALGIGTYGAPGQNRVVTVTIAQTGTDAEVQVSKAYVSALNLRQLIVGNVTLPLIARPDGAPVTLDVTVDDSGDSTFYALMLLDTRGQTVQALSQAEGTVDAVAAWLDEPEPGAALGSLWSSSTALRSGAYAITEPRVSGGHLALSRHDEGGTLLAYTAGFLPNAPALTYYPRWLAERVE